MTTTTPTTGAMAAITSLVLCGGGAQRMGGVDKPLESWRGQRLIDHALGRLPPESDVLISANRNLARYEQLGWPVITDRTKNGGPLAGIEAATSHLTRAWLYVVPGDAPRLPTDLAAAMYAACLTQNAPACCPRVVQRQPLPLLVSAQALALLPAYLQRGERSVGGWLRELGAIELHRPDEAAAFANFNTPADFDNHNASD